MRTIYYGLITRLFPMTSVWGYCAKGSTKQ